MRKAGRVVRQILDLLHEVVKPGISTQDLDRIAEEKLKELGAKSAFKGYHGYPAVLCASVNEEVVHGIPSAKRILKEGDIVSVDFGAFVEGYCGDSATTIPVGKVSAEAEKLMKVTEQSLYAAIDVVKPGAHLGDVGYAVQKVVEDAGFSVVRDFVGHGIGSAMHEDPQVPNFGQPGRGLKLKAGMVIAIEPMVNVGGYDVTVLEDGWTAVASDKSLSAHFEHTVAVTADGARILTEL